MSQNESQQDVTIEQVFLLLKEQIVLLADHSKKLDRLTLLSDDQKSTLTLLSLNRMHVDVQFDKLRLKLLDLENSIQKIDESKATHEDIEKIITTLDAHSVILQRLEQERLSGIARTDRIEEKVTHHEKILHTLQSGIAST